MTTNRRTEILLKALELIADKKSNCYNWFYEALSHITIANEYLEIMKWMTKKILGNDKDFVDLKCQEKQTLLCLAIAINEQR